MTSKQRKEIAEIKELALRIIKNRNKAGKLTSILKLNNRLVDLGYEQRLVDSCTIELLCDDELITSTEVTHTRLNLEVK